MARALTTILASELTASRRNLRHAKEELRNWKRKLLRNGGNYSAFFGWQYECDIRSAHPCHEGGEFRAGTKLETSDRNEDLGSSGGPSCLKTRCRVMMKIDTSLELSEVMDKKRRG